MPDAAVWFLCLYMAPLLVLEWGVIAWIVWMMVHD